ncbi:MAG: hypothetical protein ACXWUH_15595 [Burkholderiales bacterium]
MSDLPVSNPHGERNVSANVSDVWDFKKDPTGRWAWQRQSLRHELIQQSAQLFDTFQDCVTDAQRFGYVGSFSAADEPQRDASGRLLRLKRR